VASAELQWWWAAAACCAAKGELRKKKGGGARGWGVNLKNSRDLDAKPDFLTVLYPKWENGQNKNCRTFQNLQLLFRVQIQKLKG
jgi:hypothetical protein